jgi:methyltransferase-like protein/cyclopropane fatty-acyl-phospholipid synthase-like methyltransferase
MPMSPMALQAQQAYDGVLYPGKAHAATHPDRLATMGTLFGLQPAPVETCRVLEIGCTDGGNLLPIACALPGAELVGVDVSTRAIAAGTESVAALGLQNVRLLELDLCEIGESFGHFDYIIAHGVFSWVPAEVREKLLAVCQARLAPAGIAYISYNTHPGGFFREMVRTMMLYGTRGCARPEEQQREGLALLQWVIDARPEEDLYRAVLASELERLKESAPATLRHDDLADTRTTFYFHEFAAAAERHGLQYLSEAAYYEMHWQDFPAPAKEKLAAIPDRIAREQYLDFVSACSFRRTLLCHREHAVSEPRGAVVRKLFISSQAKPVSAAPSLVAGVEEEFQAPGNASVRTGHALAKAALFSLAKAWPQAMSFDELLATARARLAGSGASAGNEEEAAELADALLAMYAAPVLELQTWGGGFVVQAGECPVVSPYVRRAVARGEMMLTNLRHYRLHCEDELARQAMLLLDGTRDRAALADELARFCHERRIVLQGPAGAAEDRASLRKTIAEGLDANLAALGRMGVLIA